MGQVYCRVQEPIHFSWLYWIVVDSLHRKSTILQDLEISKCKDFCGILNL